MIDYIIMGGILLFLFFILLFKSKFILEGNKDFFDINNSKAMRGFWCLIVILVHIPVAYQNKIQDMIGSFAYIGVTFFFMTSAYGVSLGLKKKPDSIKKFWRTRLPKLLIPNWTVNIIFTLIFLIAFGNSCTVESFININGWVRWLFGCYLAFWLGHYFIKNNKSSKYSNHITCILVVVLSMGFYYLKTMQVVNATTWCTESIGFIWGIILSVQYEKIKAFFIKNWVSKVVLSCLFSLILGILYLKFKHVLFGGDYLLKIVLGLSIFIFILVLNSKIQIGNKIVWFLGEISFEVYLIHGYVFGLVTRTLPNISSGPFILLSVILTIFFAAFVHYFCKLIYTKIAGNRGLKL